MFCFSCRELSTSLQCEGYGPVLLLGVRAPYGVVFCLVELVVRNDVMPVTEYVRGLLHMGRDQDLPFKKTVAQRKFSEHFGSCFSAGVEQDAQQFYVTARKTVLTVVHQIARMMSVETDQYVWTAPLHSIFVCHGKRDRLANSIINHSVALTMKGMLSASKLENSGP